MTNNAEIGHRCLESAFLSMSCGAGGMPQLLRRSTASTEDLAWFPAPTLNTSQLLQLQHQISDAFSGPTGTCTHLYISKHIHVIKKICIVLELERYKYVLRISQGRKKVEVNLSEIQIFLIDSIYLHGLKWKFVLDEVIL